MDLRHLIRRNSFDIALAALSVAALGLGGGAALSGAGVFATALMPGMAAEASPPRHDMARLALAESFGPSRYAPEVLVPVAARPVPAWLTQPPSASSDPPVPARNPVIAICIDDLGEDLAGTDRAMALPKAVALSFLPFADATPFLAEEAARKGHAVLAHVPMQAVSAINPGPMALSVGMSPAEITRRMDYALNRVPRVAGINNHEGSRFSADAAALAPVVAVLKTRHLFFFDSRTGMGSRIGAVAAQAGVESASRDVFLDDDPRPEAVAAALEELAREARRTGVAIAIGHPHDTTLSLLAAWLKHDHGVTLVPLEQAMRLKQMRALAAR